MFEVAVVVFSQAMPQEGCAPSLRAQPSQINIKRHKTGPPLESPG